MIESEKLLKQAVRNSGPAGDLLGNVFTDFIAQLNPAH
jgi:hypothetical protein